MAKIVEGAALVGGAIALDVFSVGIMASATSAEMAAFDAIITSGAVIGGVGAAGAALLMSGIADALHLSDTGQTAVAAHQPFRPWQIVYGRQRVRGTMIDLSMSDGGHGDNRWLWSVEVLAAHAVKSIFATYLNQQQAFVQSGTNGLTGNLVGTSTTDQNNVNTGGMCLNIQPTDLNFREYTNFYWDGNPRFWMAQYDGTQTAADPFYMALGATGGAGTPHWDSTCIVQSMAYSLNRYWANANWAAGMPNARYDVQGKNDIFDPRTGLYGYTENAALVLADYMCNQQYGMMYNYSDFDTPTLIAAANTCDETVTLTNSQIIFNTTYSTEARYAINGTLSTSQTGGSVIEQMLAAMAGRISYVGGKWFIYPGAYQGLSGVALTETDMVGNLTWKPNRKARDLYNEVRATFICPSGWDTTYAPGFDVYNTTAQTVEDNFNGQWNQIDMPPMCFNALRDYSIDPYLQQDGNVKYIQNAQFPYTISVATAQRLAKIMLLRNRYQGTGTITLPIKYFNPVPNDIITLTYARFGWVNKQLEVQGTHINTGSVDSSGNYTAPSITLDVAEVDASIYTWNAADELKLQGGQSVAGSSRYDLAPPTNLVLESGNVTMSTPAGTVNAKSAILCTWTPTNDAHLANGGTQVINFQPSGASYWINAANVPGDQTSFLITNVNDGAAYNVQIRSVTPDGYSSEYVQAGPITVSNSTITVSANDTYYSDGKSIASLEPSMPGADITEVMTPVLVTNPGFEAGNTGWGLESYWAIIQNASLAHSGSWCAECQLTGGGDTAIHGTVLTPIKPGQVLNGQCMISASGAQGGYGQVRVSLFDANKTYTGSINGSQVAAGTAGYVLSTVIAVASPGAIYASIDCAVTGQTGGSFYVDDFALNFQTTNLSEVQNRTADLIGYTSGATVDSLQPAQAGADITSQNGDILIQNPNFLSGASGWTFQPGWTFQSGQPGNGFNGSSNYAQYYVSSGTQSGAVENNQQIPCAAGAVISAAAYCYNSGTNGQPAIRVAFFDISGNQITYQQTVLGTTIGVWEQIRVVATAPASTAYASVQFAVYNQSTGYVGVGGFSASILANSIDETPDGTTYARLAASQMSGNALDFNLPYANKGALATVSEVTNAQLLNGGVFGVGGDTSGSTAYNSVTNQDLPLNCLWNSWFDGTPGDPVGMASNADAQPALLAGSGLGLWSNFNGADGEAVWYGQGIVLVPQSSSASNGVGIGNVIAANWLGQAGDPFVASFQVAWASTTQPNGGFLIAVEPYGTSGNDYAHGVSGSFPASAFSSTQFQMAVLEGTLPALSAGYEEGWIIYLINSSTSGDYLLMQPMISPASIVSAWTSQTPTSPVYSQTAPSAPPPTGTSPGGGSGNPGGGIGYCPTLDMVLLPGLAVGDAKQGDMIDCVDTKTWERYTHPVEYIYHAKRNCVRLTAANGAQIQVSIETPFTLPDGAMRMAVEMLGEQVLTDSGMNTAAEWSKVLLLEHIGERDVCLLSLGGRTFAAGKGERRIYSHNQRKSLPQG